MKKKLLIVTVILFIGISGWIFYNNKMSGENTKGIQPGFEEGSNTVPTGC